MTNWRSEYEAEKSRRIKAEREAKDYALKKLESEQQKTERYRNKMREWDSSLQRKHDVIKELMGRIMATKRQIKQQYSGR